MKHATVLYCLFSLVGALIALANHLGLGLWGCASCSFVSEIPAGSFLAWCGPVVLSALTYLAHRESRWRVPAIGAAAAGSLGLIAWMITSHTVCTICMLVHIGVVSAAISLIPKSAFPSVVLFSLAIAFTATGGLERFASPQGEAIFRARPREQISPGKVFVLFTDPQCERCHLVEEQIQQLAKPPMLIRRWCLLPHSMYRSIRAATLVEMTRAKAPESLERLQDILSHAKVPLTDEVLLDAARRSGIGDKASEWLANPAEQALVAIDEDQTTARELGIQSLPALAELSEPDLTGIRTMKLVPFSAIGIGP